jgi:hypothetical protein
MPNIPTPIRAALGLAATAVAEARKLPETLPQLPVAVVSTAMQASLRVQQRIATYAARGDEVISQLRGTSAEPPAWATFDDDPADWPDPADSAAKAAFDRVEPVNLEDTAADLADLGGSEVAESGGTRVGAPGGAEPAHLIDTAAATSGQPAADIEGKPDGAPPSANAGKAAPAKAAPTKKAPANAAPAKAAPAKAAPAKAAPGTAAPGTAAPGKTPPAKVSKATAEAPAKKAPATKAAGAAPAKKAPGRKAPAKKSEPLAEAARKADPAAGPNPSTMAAEILHAHQAGSPGQQ